MPPVVLSLAHLKSKFGSILMNTVVSIIASRFINLKESLYGKVKDITKVDI